MIRLFLVTTMYAGIPRCIKDSGVPGRAQGASGWARSARVDDARLIGRPFEFGGIDPHRTNLKCIHKCCCPMCDDVCLGRRNFSKTSARGRLNSCHIKPHLIKIA